MIISVHGSPYERGLMAGQQMRRAISLNVSNFWTSLDQMGISRTWLTGKLEDWECEENQSDEIHGMSRATGIPINDLRAFNAYRKIFFPDECTMMMAMGNATVSGNTIYLKNSDKVGGKELVGAKYHSFKEINVVRFEQVESGTRIIGVSAAGETGLKMGINNKGVATGSNISRTTELKNRKVDLTRIRALDRAELLRRGLYYPNALQAGKAILDEILENPMATPGNVHFVDPSGAYLLEGSYDKVAAQYVKDDVAIRANGFVLMKELNDPTDISTQARYIRGSSLLQENKGSLTPEKFVQFSQDHENGPGLNSICRHNNDYSKETSLSAMVMEIDRNTPSASKIRICLGKPCHAWNNPAGNISLTANTKFEDIPESYKDGSAWKQFYSESPYQPKAS
ncbi:MAG: C45 family autoproteolytic acyltransferase/hydrolase [Nitrososphaerales archaeon]